MQHKILVVDDDAGLLEMVTYNLEQNGYQIVTASDGVSGFEIACAERPDLVILDITLPGMNGLDVCRRLREEKSMATVPIIMLTAKLHESDKVVGFEVGADDYIIKPFGPRELLARVRALLRRVEQTPAQKKRDPSHEISTLVAGPLTIDLAGRRVICRGQEVSLQPKQFDLLLYFVRNRGIVVTRDQLLEHVWGEDYEGGMRTIDVHVRWLREKLEEDPAHPRLIKTVLRVGYCFR